MIQNTIPDENFKAFVRAELLRGLGDNVPDVTRLDEDTSDSSNDVNSIEEKYWS